jgi:2-dehydro-3-deoxyphosphogluconate aldolase/(4S)-4-hydroxy-2-oxoglutarate aldolase
MSKKFRNLSAIEATGCILIVRVEDPDEALAVSRAAVEGGIRALEITLSVPGAIEVIRKLATEYKSDGIVVGAGTVLDGHAAYEAMSAGAELLVSPQLNPEMLAVANRYQAVSVSGAMTPTEIVDTVSAGADIVKLFPADHLGPQYVQSVLAPLAHIPIAPTGGVTPENVGEWFDAGVVAVGVGSFVTTAADGGSDYHLVTKAATSFLNAVADARRTT